AYGGAPHGRDRAASGHRRAEDARRPFQVLRDARRGAPPAAAARRAYRRGAGRARDGRGRDRAAAEREGGVGRMFTGLSHVSIVVPDLDVAARRLRETYGLTVGETRTNAEQGVHLAYVELGNARIELMAPSRPDSPVAKFLERNPKGGIHHVSLNVD